MRLQSILLYVAGLLTIVIAAMHVGLPAMWGWYREIKELSTQSRKTIIDRNSFLILLLLIIAFLTFAFNADLQQSDTGRTLLTLLGLYWVLRGIWRYCGYPKGAATVAMAILYMVTGLCFLLPLIP